MLTKTSHEKYIFKFIYKFSIQKLQGNQERMETINARPHECTHRLATTGFSPTGEAL